MSNPPLHMYGENRKHTAGSRGFRAAGMTFLLLLLLSVFLTAAPLSAFAAGSAAPDGNGTPAETGRKIVRVGYYEDNNGFQMGFSDDTRKSGYAYEYYQEISKYAGWEYRYVYGPWSELYGKLLSGEIDIMAGVSKTDERTGRMLYPDNIMGTESYYVFVPVNKTDIRNGDIGSLNGKRIGVNDNSLMLTLFRQFVSEHALDCEIKTYDGHLSCAAALQNGEIDGYVITDNYVVEGVKPVFKIGGSDIYFAIANGREDLLKDINDAQNQLLAASPYYVTYLQSKYFNRSIMRQALNDEELSWLRERGKIRIGYIDGQLPYCGTDANGETAGLVQELQQKIASFLGIPAETSSYAGSEELLAALKAGEIDTAFPVYDDTWSAEQAGIYLTKEIISDRMTAVYTGKYDPSLLSKTALAVSGISQEPYLKQYYPDSEIVRYPDLQASVKALKDGKVTSIILDNNLVQRYLGETDGDSRLHVAYLDSPSSFCMAVSESGTTLQSILNKALANIDSSSLADAIARNTYGTANYSLGSFLRHNMVLVIGLLAGLLIMITCVFLVYRRKSLANSRKLTEANRAKSDFLSRMSHDMRTPLNGIIGMTYLTEKMELPDRVRENLTKIDHSSRFLLGLINDVLDMSKMESGKIELRQEPYSIEEFEQYITAVIQPLCADRNQKLITECSMPEGCVPLVDKLRMNQIVFNLLSNAVKYSPEGSSILYRDRSSLTPDGKVHDCIEVTDHGVGMSSEFQQVLFQPFTQENRIDNSEMRGSGLGLAIVKKIVDAMGGTISVDSRIGKGTTIRVELDLERMPQTQQETQEKVSAADRNEKNRLSGKHILLCEDNPLNQEIARTLLTGQGAVVVTAEDGETGLRAFGNSSVGYYDCILMDIRMPVMNGYEATEAIRRLSRPDAGTVLIIAMTADAYADDIRKCLSAGMDGHISKPIDPEQFFRTISDICRRKEQQRP